MFLPVNAAHSGTWAVFGGVAMEPSEHSQFPSRLPPAVWTMLNHKWNTNHETTSCQMDTAVVSIEANFLSSLNSGPSSHGFTQSCGKVMQTEPGRGTCKWVKQKEMERRTNPTSLF